MQTAICSSDEPDKISLDAGLRLDFQLFNLECVLETLSSKTATGSVTNAKESFRLVHILTNVCHVPPIIPNSSRSTQLCIFEDTLVNQNEVRSVSRKPVSSKATGMPQAMSHVMKQPENVDQILSHHASKVLNSSCALDNDLTLEQLCNATFWVYKRLQSFSNSVMLSRMQLLHFSVLCQHGQDVSQALCEQDRNATILSIAGGWFVLILMQKVRHGQEQTSHFGTMRLLLLLLLCHLRFQRSALCVALGLSGFTPDSRLTFHIFPTVPLLVLFSILLLCVAPH